MKPNTTFRASLALSLTVAAGAGFAQQPPQQNGAAPTAIQRHTDRVTAVGEFPHDEQHAPVPQRPTNGDVGSTGAVAERRPDDALRGSTGPAPGEIDMNQPIGPGDVARIVRAYEPRFRPCYDHARATHPALAGRVSMRFVIGRDGSLSGIDVAGIPEAPEVATCIRTELQATHFPRPEAGTLPFAYGMNFAPPATRRGRARPVRPAQPVRPAH